MYALFVSLAFIQIAIELIPISSSGHLYWFKKYSITHGYLPQGWMMPEWFEYLINIPTIFVLLFFFRVEICEFLFRLFRLCVKLIKSTSLSNHEKKWLTMIGTLFSFVIIADILTAIPYFSCRYFFPCALYDQQQILGFLITAAFLFSFKKKRSIRTTACSLVDTCLIGLVQGGAKLFSYSRFGSTLALAHYRGFSMRRSFQFSFLVYMPLLFVSSLKGLLVMPSKIVAYFTFETMLAVIIASLVSYGAFCLVWFMAQKQLLWLLGFYMLIPILGIIFL